MHRFPIAAVAVTAAFGLAACGGEDEGLTKAEWIKQADVICADTEKKGEALVEDAFKDPSNPTGEETQAFVKKGLEVQEEETKQIRDLEVSDGEKDKVDAILSEVDKTTEALREASKTPESSLALLQSGDDPGKEADRLAKDYGLKECGKG